MPNTKSAEKALRVSEKKRLRNQAVETRIKSSTRKALRLIRSGGSGEAGEALREAVQVIDRAAAKGVIHRNAASRRKSRLMRRLQQAGLSST